MDVVTPPRTAIRNMVRPAAAGALVLTAMATAYGQVGYGLLRQWASDPDYSHGFAIVPLAAFFAWRRRDALRRAPVRPAPWALVAVLAALALLIVGRVAGDLFLPRVSLVALVPAMVLFLFGWAYVRVLAFPMAFLLLMVPLPAIVFNEIAFPLQQVASSAGELALRTGGVPVLRHGNVLELATMRLEVAEACSGIRSLMALLTVALVIGEIGPPSRWRPWLLAIATVPVAILANAARVAVTGFAANSWGPAATEGTPHELAGALVFIVAVAALLAIERAASRPSRLAATAS